MFENSKKWMKIAAFAALMGFAPEMFAQAVIFPQEQQPGIAVANHQGETFTLGNEVLTANFKYVDKQLTFEGCPQLNLLPCNELFYITLKDGSVKVPASAMALSNVEVENLVGKADAATGSFRKDGKAIKATYTYKDGNNADLTIVWRAILRDGSHYLRTKMDITANKDTKMYTMVPMKYTVDNTKSEKVPTVVGNTTRGAIILNDKIFAGLESPMGVNTVEAEGASMDLQEFVAKSWDGSNSFKWHPGEATPDQIITNGAIDTSKKLTKDNVVGARGYVKFYEQGNQTITFTYAEGGHKLDIVGVDLLDKDGNIVAKDYHKGTTGDSHNKNVYTLNVPTPDVYQVRYFIDTATETIMSKGSITYSKKTAPVQVLFDGKPNPNMQTVHKIGRAGTGITLGENDEYTHSWNKSSWKDFTGTLPQAIYDKGWTNDNIQYSDRTITLTDAGELTVDFQYAKGNNRIDLAGVFLLDANGKEIGGDSHKGFSGTNKEGNVYKVNVPNAGTFTLRYYVGKDKNDSEGNVIISLPKVYTMHLPAPKTSTIQALWRRDVVLEAQKTWNVSAVVGLVAKDQARRSVLSYVERERAVPWRAYPIYNSWYELNIDRNNDRNYTTNMHDYQCVEIVKQWQKNLYGAYGEGIKAFVWDDGWDIYGTWQFNQNFPNGFAEMDKLARQMNAGTGAWLGPVGGYGTSGGYRRDYWNQPGMGGMVLGNPKYYDVFYKGCTDLMVNNGYDFRYFKFDGISAHWSSVGPDEGTQGEENAEGIIYAELDMRKVNPHIFFNTSVGTWASPFWFRITDAVWRQENDYGEIGNNKNSRENWITYRDRLVYQNFVQRSPMCPINDLMTHGFILSDHGPVSKDRTYKNIVNELRCAFACGSAMVELYNDFKLMNSIEGGKLWGDLAECIAWQKKNEEVLPDIHWVGGNPWDGTKCNVYGWGAWNGTQATLALRNGGNDPQVFETTLREALEIPAYQKGSITFLKGFANQNDLEGLPVGQPIDYDKKLKITLPGSSVFVFDNTPAKVTPDFVMNDPATQVNNLTAFTIKSVNRGYVTFNANLDQNYLSSSFGDADNFTDATPTNARENQFGFVRTESMPADEYYLYSLGAGKFVTPDGVKMRLTPVPMSTVKLVATGNNTYNIVYGDKCVNITTYEDHHGMKITNATPDDGNKMTITAVNHKAGLFVAANKIEEWQMHQKFDRSQWTVEASSWCYDNNEKTQGQPENVLDDNINSFWHSNWKEQGGTGTVNKMPYTLTFDLKAPQQFCSFGYFARLDSGNGVVKGYKLEISNDKQTWLTVKTGELASAQGDFSVGNIGKTVEAQYVRLTITSNNAGNNFACMSEFYLGNDDSAVDPTVTLPVVSETSNSWYMLQFRNGLNVIENKGLGNSVRLAKANPSKNQMWKLVGTSKKFQIVSPEGKYLVISDQAEAGTNQQNPLRVADTPYAAGYKLLSTGNSNYMPAWEIASNDAKFNGKAFNMHGGNSVNNVIGQWNASDPNNPLQFVEVGAMDIATAEGFGTFYSDKAYTMPAGVNGYTVSAASETGLTTTLAYAEGAKVPANTALLVEGAQAEYFFTFTKEKAATAEGVNLLKGSAVDAETTGDADSKFYKLSYDEAGQNLGFYWGAANGAAFQNKAGKAYLVLPGNVKVQGFRLDGTTTGIESVETEENGEAVVYNLAGVRVNANLSQLPKGVYIVNGKKVIIK